MTSLSFDDRRIYTRETQDLLGDKREQPGRVHGGGLKMKKQDKGLVVARVGMMLALFGAAFMPVSYALDPLASLVSWGPALLLIGFIVMAVGAVMHYAGVEKVSMPALVVGALVFVVGLGGWIGGVVLQPSGGGGDDVPVGYAANWECNFFTLAAGGPGGAHDAITEFPDSPFVAADGGTPDLNKVIATPILDLVQKRAVVDVSVDDDLANTAAGYLDEDAYAFDLRCKLLNPLPAVGGGLQEIPIWGRISVTRTAGSQNNGSFARVFYSDVTAGDYLGFGSIADSGAAADGHDVDHTYTSYTSQLTAPAAGPLVGEWRPLGTSDGDPDGEWIAVWYVLDVGLSDYSTPSVGTTLTISVELGTDPTSTQYKGNIQQAFIDLRLLARA